MGENKRQKVYLWIASLPLAIVAFLLLTLSVATPVNAAAGINSQLSFEGKIVNSDGTNITNGTYNMEFKVYQDGSNNGTGGTLMWTEDYLVSGSTGMPSTAGVALSSGTFQVNLGSICAFSGGTCGAKTNTGVDWNQQTLWLSMEIGNSSSCTVTSSTTSFHSACGGDTAMTPFIRLTAVPQAQDSAKLGGIASSGFIQNATSTQTANIDVQSAASGSIAAVIQGASGQSVDTFQVKANGVTAPLFAVGSAGEIDVNTDTATALQINTSYTPDQYSTSTAFIVSNGTGTGPSVGIGTDSPSGTLDVTGINASIVVNSLAPSGEESSRNALIYLNGDVGNGVGQVGILFGGLNGIGYLGDLIQSGNLGLGVQNDYIYIDSDNKTIESSPIFEVQDASLNPLFDIDSTSTPIITFTPSTLQRTASGTTTIDLNDTSATTLAITNSGSSGIASITATGDIAAGSSRVFKVGSTSGSTISACGSSQFLASQAVAGGIVTGGTCTNAASSLSSAYNTAATTGNTIVVTSSGGGVKVQDASTPLTTGTNLFAVQKNAGSITYLGVTSTGINIQSNATGSAVNALAFDTSTTVPHLKVYGANGTSYADIYYDSSTSTAYYGASTGTAVLGSGTGAVSISAGTGTAFTLTGNAASTISTTSGDLTLDAAGGTLVLGTNTSTVQKAATSLTLDVNNSSNSTLLVTNGGTGTASLSVEAGVTAGGNITAGSSGTFTTASGTATYTGPGAVTLSSTTTLSLQGGTTASLLSSSTNSVTVDSGTTGSVIIGATNNTNAKGVSIGNNNAGSTVDIDGGTAAAAIEIGDTTTAHGIKIGSNNTAANAIVIGANNGSSTLTLDAGSNASSLQIGDSTTAHSIAIGAGGAAAGNVEIVTIGSASTTTGSQVKLQGGNITTTNNNSGIIIGAGFTDDGNLVGLTLDTSDLFNETASTCTSTVNQGTIYFNNVSSALRACVGSSNSTASWEDVVTTSGMGLLLFGVIPDSATNLGSAGDLAGVGASGANGSGPCKVYIGSTTATIRWTACAAYSGGRKVLVAAQTANYTPPKSTSGTQWDHICLTGTNNQPVSSPAAAGTGAENANLPTFSANNPVLCIADVSVSTSAVTGIYDTRTFTTTDKDFVDVTTGTSVGIGVPVIPSGTGVVVMGASATSNILGVIVAWGGATTGTPNAIIATQGPVWAKATAGTAGAAVTASTTAGRVITGGTPAGPYGYFGMQRSITWSATCTAGTASTCQLSDYFSMILR